MAEYGAQKVASGTTEYLTADVLGTTRLVTYGSGLAKSCTDYLPFGGSVLVRAGDPRFGLTCFPLDRGVRLKYTGKERDAETGLDYFGPVLLGGAGQVYIAGLVRIASASAIC